MNMTAEKRATAFIRKLRVGDKFNEFERGSWVTVEVAREPEVIGNEVHVHLKTVPYARNSRARKFAYDKDARVRVV